MKEALRDTIIFVEAAPSKEVLTAAFIFSIAVFTFASFCAFQWRREIIELFFFATKLKRHGRSEE